MAKAHLSLATQTLSRRQFSHVGLIKKERFNLAQGILIRRFRAQQGWTLTQHGSDKVTCHIRLMQEHHLRPLPMIPKDLS